MADGNNGGSADNYNIHYVDGELQIVAALILDETQRVNYEAAHNALYLSPINLAFYAMPDNEVDLSITEAAQPTWEEESEEQ